MRKAQARLSRAKQKVSVPLAACLTCFEIEPFPRARLVGWLAGWAGCTSVPAFASPLLTIDTSTTSSSSSSTTASTSTAQGLFPVTSRETSHQNYHQDVRPDFQEEKVRRRRCLPGRVGRVLVSRGFVFPSLCSDGDQARSKNNEDEEEDMCWAGRRGQTKRAG